MSTIPLQSLPFPQQAYLLAVCSNLAYYGPEYSVAKYKEFGFDAEFISHDGSQAYVLTNDTDVIVVCRGTQPREFEDIKSALNVFLVPYMTGRVHHGFKQSVDNIWPQLYPILHSVQARQNIWCAGHSLGAAMAVFLVCRIYENPSLQLPKAVFTYGCPRVGDKGYVKFLDKIAVPTHRFVNNVDIVTSLPPYPYMHQASMHYMNHWGNVREVTIWQLIKDRVRGVLKGLKKGKINYFVNHEIRRYCDNLSRWASGREIPDDDL